MLLKVKGENSCFLENFFFGMLRVSCVPNLMEIGSKLWSQARHDEHKDPEWKDTQKEDKVIVCPMLCFALYRQ